MDNHGSKSGNALRHSIFSLLLAIPEGFDGNESKKQVEIEEKEKPRFLIFEKDASKRYSIDVYDREQVLAEEMEVVA